MKTQTILVVEDSGLLRSVVSDALRDVGFTLIEAENGQIGLDIALREHPDLIMLDLMMPVMDGTTMYKHLRADVWGKDVPVIMLTSNTKNEEISAWLTSEQLDFFTKDNWMMDEVVLRVKKRLGVE
jgi:DNA-binding response OmpR family regulator